MKIQYKSLFLILFALVIFLLFHYLFPLEVTRTISDNFNKIAIGIAALMTAYFGTSYFIEEVMRKRKIDFYRKEYPYDEYGKTWEIIVREDRTGEPHVLDKQTNEIHHLWNMKTIFDLGWQFYERKSVSKKKFDSLKRGDYIRTRGELGE